MNSIKEILQSLFDSSRDRIKNPVIGAFAFSWMAINWRIVLVLLFSDKKIIDKIQHIQDNYVDLVLNFWYPLGFSVFYVLVLPYLMALFDWLSQKAISYRRLISKNHRISEIQGRQEIAAEEWQLEKIRQGSPDISGLKDKIVDLENQLTEKDELINTLRYQLESEGESSTSEEMENKPARKTSARKTSKSIPKESISTATKSSAPNQPDSYPVMKDIVIRDLAKTEREWMLIYALYSSEFGKKTFTRDDLISKYQDSDRKTDSRMANLSNNIRNLIKANYFKYINDDEMLLTTQGQEMANEILNR